MRYDQDQENAPTYRPSFEDLVLSYMDETDRMHLTIERGGVTIDLIEALTENVARARLAVRRHAAQYPDDVPGLPSLQAAAIQGLRIAIDSAEPGDMVAGQEFLRMAHVIRDLAHPGMSLKTGQSNRLMARLRLRKKRIDGVV